MMANDRRMLPTYGCVLPPKQSPIPTQTLPLITLEVRHPFRFEVGHDFRLIVASGLVATDQAHCASQVERVATSCRLAFDRSEPSQA